MPHFNIKREKLLELMPKDSICAELGVGRGNFSKIILDIENPKTFDRQHWVEKLSMCHWKFEELKNGAAWTHIKQYM